MATEVIRKEPLSKQELNKLWFHYMCFDNGCCNLENWFAYGWVYSFIPFYQKFYNKEGQIEGMERHLDWYNSNFETASVIFGVLLSMEESKALNGDVDGDLIRTTKASLMGPVAGIADSFVQGTIVPLLMAIACSITGTNGNVAGPIFYIIAYLTFINVWSYSLFRLGYNSGKKAVSVIAGDKMKYIADAFSLFGVIVVGTLASMYVAPKLALSFTAADAADPTMIQGLIDGIFPNILGLGLVLGCYWLVKKKNVSIIKMVFGLMLLVVLLTFFKVL